MVDARHQKKKVQLRPIGCGTFRDHCTDRTIWTLHLQHASSSMYNFRTLVDLLPNRWVQTGAYS